MEWCDDRATMLCDHDTVLQLDAFLVFVFRTRQSEGGKRR